MANKYNQGAVSVSSARFTKAPMGELEFSRMYAEPSHTTTFNAGSIVPIYCGEVLPHGTYSVDIDTVVRQATLKVPSMDRAIIDIFAYFVPHRVVNKSWKNVMGENTSGSWTAPAVSLAPLAGPETGNVLIPVGSVADYYGYPTQQPIPSEVLQSCHDLKIRGYLEIYNNYFRDQNYQPPIPYSKLNVYNGFLEPVDNVIGFNGYDTNTIIFNGQGADGSYGAGAIKKELVGADGVEFVENYPEIPGMVISVPARVTNWRATNAPLKANKLHDYFTSVLPSPQKGEQVVVAVGESAPVVASSEYMFTDDNNSIGNSPKLLQLINQGSLAPNAVAASYVYSSSGNSGTVPANSVLKLRDGALYADLSQSTGISIADLRDSVAVQQVYEILGRGGSRYTEYINSFFELDIDNPFDDIPTCLGHIRRNLDLYQTAQTSASTDDSAQGNLSAFGYTSTGGKLFTRTFLEHGYIHIMAVVRHKNIYPAMLSRDNFRLSMMDFYQYPLANISEQPVYAREINPYAGNSQVFGYQEAWAEYRTEPDRVSGLMRTGLGENGIDAWTYADTFDADLRYADGNFMESNSQEVIARGTAFLPTEDINNTPQFKAKFTFKITKELPMPTYSMAGLDIL